MIQVELSPRDLISKAKILSYRKYPYHSYLVEHLNFSESESVPSMGVDDEGNCVYNSEFIKKLNTEQLLGVLCHEVFHVAWRHVERGLHRTAEVNGFSLWNIAVDISTNYYLQQDGLSLPPEGLLPNGNEYTFLDYTIKDIDKKSAEDIYNELKQHLKKIAKEVHADNFKVDASGEKLKGFDEAPKKSTGKKNKEKGKGTSDKGENKKGKDKSTSDKGRSKKADKGEDKENGKKSDKKNGKNWDRILAEAYEYAKKIGKEPAGFERQYNKLHESKLDWKSILRKAVSSAIPMNHTYRRPNRKFIWGDLYLPRYIGEQTDVICLIDTSGSMGYKEFNEILSELVGISKLYASVYFRIITHDVVVHDDIEIKRGKEEDIKSLQLHGGGGTSHIHALNYVTEKGYTRQSKLLIMFTDGYSDLEECEPTPFHCIAVLTSVGNKNSIPKWIEVIQMEE